MVKVCIVEDEADQAQLLKNYIEHYSSESGEEFHITCLPDGIDLVDEYKSQFDIILLDIQMKHLDGMAAAQKVRAIDQDVIIIFITSTVRYAVQGYSVDALGYVLKPVSFIQLQQLFDKALARIRQKRDHVYIRVSVGDSQLKIDCENIFYIESSRNNVILHCRYEEYVTLGPLKKFDEMLEGHGFAKCHNAYLVNLSHVEGVKKEEVILSSGATVPISRARKKGFMASLLEYS
ncbi:MAG: LytTR family DNA-binding domain-containing protein [Butyrivibrio sp.]|nr:LytTR family DNA-binding domain-containing protein [Butyrivibrio sp.]